MYDFPTVQAAFPKAHLVGGRLIAYIDGKNVEIGLTHAKTGTFALTAQGQELMDGMQAKPKRGRTAAPPLSADDALALE